MASIGWVIGSNAYTDDTFDSNVIHSGEKYPITAGIPIVGYSTQPATGSNVAFMIPMRKTVPTGLTPSLSVTSLQVRYAGTVKDLSGLSVGSISLTTFGVVVEIASETVIPANTVMAIRLTGTLSFS